jgi:hypothetical protein
MNACRVARRVALVTQRENVCADRVSARTLVTKVFHLSFHRFSASGRPAQRRADGGRWQYGSGVAGVQSWLIHEGARRLAWPPAPHATPSITPSWVTKRRKGKAKR